MKLQVYDLDNKTADLSDDDYLGGIECTLGQVCGFAYLNLDSDLICICLLT